MNTLAAMSSSGDLRIILAEVGIVSIGLFVIHSLFFSKKTVPPAVYFFLGIALFLIIYIANPNVRIYSNHGLFHTGIVYEILNGHLPPGNPFLSGTRLLYPWGYHLLAGELVQSLQISPFWAFALINLVSLAVCLIMFYKAARLVVTDRRVNTFQVLFSLFGVTPAHNFLFDHLYKFYVYFPLRNEYEPRANPVFQKFINVNGMSIGLAFFSLFLYALLKATQERRIGKYLLMLFMSLLGAGSLYPPVLPAFVVGLIAWGGIRVYYESKIGDTRGRSPFAIFFIIVVLTAIALLVLFPYLAGISQEISKNYHLFSNVRLKRKLFSYSVACFPMLALFVYNRKAIVNAQNRSAVATLLSLFVTCSLLYLAVNFPRLNEYKYLILAQISVAFLGGASFGLARTFPKMLMMMVLVGLFISPFYYDSVTKLNYLKGAPPKLLEQGIYVYPTDRDERETYEWIKDHTPKKSVWLDKTAMVPIYAQRVLWVGFPDQSTGYDFKTMELVAFAPGSKERREKIPLILSTDLKDDHPKDLYILDRRYDPFPQIGAFYNRLFTSNDGTYTIYSKNKG